MKAVVKIKNDGGVISEITLNGLDISTAVTSYGIRQIANDLPRIDLALYVLPDFEGVADVKIPDHTRAALIAMGWTAPPEEE